MFGFLIGECLTGFGVWNLTVSFREPNLKMGIDWFHIIFFGLMILFGQSAVFESLKRVPRIFIAQLVLVIISLPITALWGGGINATVEKAASDVCLGNKIENTSGYSNNSSIHPIVIIYKSTGRSFRRNNYPADWLPKTEGDLQLVACIDEQWKTLERCNYGSNSVLFREQQIWTVELLDTKSLQEIEKFEIQGGVPSKCSDKETFVKGGEYKQVRGESITSEQLISQLSRFVNP